MTFKAWHWKDLDGGGRRETGREDGGGWFEKVFLHLNITGKVLILKAKVNWSFHLLSLASPLRLRTRRASQKRRRGFCLKRFGYHQLSCKCGYGLDILNSYGKYGNGFEGETAPFIKSTFLKTDDDLVFRSLTTTTRTVSTSQLDPLSFFQRFFSNFFLQIPSQLILAEHQWFNRHLQSINDTTDTCRAFIVQPIYSEHGDVAGDLDRRRGRVWVQDLFQPLHIRCVSCMVHNVTFIVHINHFVFVISIYHLSRFGLAVIAALRVCKMDNEITWPWWPVIVVIILFIIIIMLPWWTVIVVIIKFFVIITWPWWSAIVVFTFFIVVIIIIVIIITCPWLLVITFYSKSSIFQRQRHCADGRERH